jgi:hypothetical protein
VVVPQPERTENVIPAFKGSGIEWWLWKTDIVLSTGALTDELSERAPYRVGERVALTEGFYVQTDMGFKLSEPQPIEYAANVTDRRQVEDYRYLPARFMPCWASRQIVTITSVSGGRLHDMTDEGYRREGVTTLPWFKGDLLAAWIEWWDKLDGHRYPYESNPWTFHYGYERE